MAKRVEKTVVFLIIDERGRREALAAKLHASGFDVHDYMTPREFLIDKRNHSSGVVVADYRLQGITGLELAEQLTREAADFPFVIMAGHGDIPKVIVGKISDVVVKPVAMDAMTEAITRVVEGEEITDDELQRSFGRLTARELEIIGIVAEGKSSREIGAALGISTKTVEGCRARIMDKTRAVAGVAGVGMSCRPSHIFHLFAGVGALRQAQHLR
jgi:two-component system response regulator FixJ